MSYIIYNREEIKKYDVEIHSELSIKYLKIKKYEKAYNHLLIAAKLQNTGSRYNLGFIYEYGLGVKPSFIEAAKWYSSCGNDFPLAIDGLKRVIQKKQSYGYQLGFFLFR